jgi:two-component system sensor histidine kinase AlgZ
VVITLISYIRPGWAELGLVSMMIQWIVLLSSALICTLRTSLEKLPVWMIGFFSYLCILFATMIVTMVSIWFFHQNVEFGQFSKFTDYQWSMLFRNLAVASILGGILLRYFYLQQQYRIRLAAETNARMEALHARIHPHFLFNTLNSIAALIQISPSQAEEAIENLSALMRATLREMRVMVPWESEINLCLKYLQLEELRLGERLRQQINIDEVPDDYPVPGLLLQPLIENSVLHGIARLPEGGLLKLDASIKNEGLAIRLENPLPPKNNTRRQGHGIGLSNVEERLKLLYQLEATLKVTETESDYIIDIWIPRKHRHEVTDS